MADYGVRRRTQSFIEVVLPAPTNAVEVNKAIATAQHHWNKQNGADARQYDDSIKVRVEDDAIVFVIEADESETPA